MLSNVVEEKNIHVLSELLNELYSEDAKRKLLQLGCNTKSLDFPGGAVVGSPPANAGDTGSSPGLGRSHMPRSN